MASTVAVKSTLAYLLLVLPFVYSTSKNTQRQISNVMQPQESWITVENHGLMLSHYQSRMKYINGNPIVSSRSSDIPLFASAISGLTSSSGDFVSWDDDLVNELKEAPLPRQASTAIVSRDVATRSGLVHLNRDSRGNDYISIETLKAVAATPFISNRSSMIFSPRRMVKRVDHSKRSTKDKAKELESLLANDQTSIDVMKGATIHTKITWYTGHDLLNPYCAQKSGWTPTDDSLVIAVTQVWKLRPKCGDFMELVVVDKHDGQVGKSVVARVVDLCGGCAPEVPHADLSKAAFTRLFNLDVGMVSGLAMRRVPPPKKWSVNLYGPRIL